jgi:ubiquinone/menaquinone biosynthesis C-methylase UbiE
MEPLHKKVPNGFTGPTALPSSPEQQRFWQDANRTWWQRNPMRYDWATKIAHPEFSKDFYEEIDRRFFDAASEYLPWKSIPFDRLIDFAELRDKDVLEVGVGNGSHAALLARHAKSFTGIDLTEYAVQSTSERLKCFNLVGTVRQMDAESMSFGDRSFDFVWSWGVIHHSSDTRKILSEIARVLRPGGRAVTMVYHRNAWNYYLVGGVIHGLVRGRLFKARSLHEVVQLQTDGAIARYYSEPEWRTLASEFLDVDGIQVRGSKSELLPLPSGRLKWMAAALMPGPVARFFTHRCKWGSLLVSVLSSRP